LTKIKRYQFLKSGKLTTKMNIKAQSQVISTILLILLSISAAALIMAFAIPFVKNQLSSSDCFDVADKLEITNGQYTCYDDTATPKQMLLQVHLKDTDNIQGFVIELGEASTETYEIKDNNAPPEVTMYNPANPIELPGQNQERTYRIESPTKPELIRVSIKGRLFFLAVSPI